MKKTSSHKNGNPKRRVLATKGVLVPMSSPEKNVPLQFKQISEEELKASRNSAYSYLIK